MYPFYDLVTKELGKLMLRIIQYYVIIYYKPTKYTEYTKQ